MLFQFQQPTHNVAVFRGADLKNAIASGLIKGFPGASGLAGAVATKSVVAPVVHHAPVVRVAHPVVHPVAPAYPVHPVVHSAPAYAPAPVAYKPAPVVKVVHQTFFAFHIPRLCARGPVSQTPVTEILIKYS